MFDRKESGVAVQHLRRRIWLAGLVAITAAASFSQARQSIQTMAVSAQVSPSATLGLELVAQPLQIKSADLDRGYVDVVMKSRMRVRNARNADLHPAVAMTLGRPGSGGDGHGKADGNGNGHADRTRVVETSSQGEYAEFRYRFEFSRLAQQGAPGGTISVSIDL